MEINKIYNCDCLIGLKELNDNSVDLTITSPPYDNLRSYDNTLEWGFEVFKPIARELYRVTKEGGVVVWVIGDAVINGSETGSSFKQALYFMDCGFKLHDTMIYEKNGSSFPAKTTSKRYSQIFEYMFVFTKGTIRKDIKLIADKKNKWAGWTNWGKNTKYDKDGKLIEMTNIKPIPEYSLRNNIWKYSVSFNDKTGHPAVFPEKLAEDHILSWTNEGDLVLDPFMGSGTSAKMAMINNRNFIGFEKNTEYYEKSLERIGKYVGTKNTVKETTIVDENGATDTYYDTSDDSETEAKTELWNKLINELNTYFNEQILSTLKTLKFTFSSKTNEEKVRKRTENNDEQKEKTNITINKETDEVNTNANQTPSHKNYYITDLSKLIIDKDFENPKEIDKEEITTPQTINNNQKPIRKRGNYIIQQFSLNDELIKEYYSINDVIKEVNISQSSLSQCLHGKIKKSGGYKWKKIEKNA